MASPQKNKMAKEQVQDSPEPQLRGYKTYLLKKIVSTSSNDKFVNAPDSSRTLIISRVPGGMEVEAKRDEAPPFAGMPAAQDVASKLMSPSITVCYEDLRATGGNSTITPGPGTRLVLRPSIKIAHIVHVSANPSDS